MLILLPTLPKGKSDIPETDKMTTTPEITTNNMRQQAFNHLKQKYGLAEQVIETLLTKASVTLAESLQSLQMAAEANDREKAKDVAHALKGALLNLGLDELSAQAKIIELSTTLDEITIKSFIENLNSSDLL